MSTRPPPRHAVQPADASAASQARRNGLIAAWLGSLLAVALISAWLAGSGAAPTANDNHGRTSLRAQNGTLKQQLADLRQARTVDKVSMQRLQAALSSRDEQINGLRADLAFYARLVGGSGQRGALHLQNVRLSAVPKAPRAWNLALTLTRNARKGDTVDGSVDIRVEGIEKGTLATLDWPHLNGSTQTPAPNFAFKYFQQLHSTLMLPEGFTPNRLTVTLRPRHGDSVSQTIDWSEALKKGESHVASG